MKTNGATEITDMCKTDENKALIKCVLVDVLQDGESKEIAHCISTEMYLLKNSQAADGQAGQAMAYARTTISEAEGDVVFTASEGKLGEMRTASLTSSE
ncbi:MAG: hypothetical protein AAFO01_10595 [Pseudomonadota bacterium]